MAKVGTENWDAQPLVEYLDKGYIRNQANSQAGSESLEVHAINKYAHSIYFSSNKYVGVKTITGDNESINKVVRGENFTLPKVKGLVAWETGEENSAQDIIFGEEIVLAAVSESATYNALCIDVKDSAYASLRFRPIDVNAELTEDNIQVSIKWTAQVNRADVEVMANKLGATAEIGYVITKHGLTDAEDMKSPEMIVESFAGDTFAVLQSGIDKANYSTQFSMQSFVKFTFADDSTIYVWGEVNEDGYTQNNNTVENIVNGAWNTATGEQSQEYCYEVEEGVYSCYDVTLYNVLKNYYQSING